MDFSDILFYIVLGAIGIFSSFSQKAAQKKAKEIEHRKAQQRTAVEEKQASEATVSPVDDREEYYEEESDESWNEETPQELPTLEEIFRALREGRSIEKPTPTPVVTPVVEAPQVEAVVPTQPLYVEGERAVNDITLGEITDEGIYQEDDNSNVFDSTRIDWRQAVITSEILTRKY